MFDDSDTDDDIFPSMPSNINFQERPKFKQPYDLVDLEHQLILADGLVKPLVPLSTATATATAAWCRCTPLRGCTQKFGQEAARRKLNQILSLSSAKKCPPNLEVRRCGR